MEPIIKVYAFRHAETRSKPNIVQGRANGLRINEHGKIQAVELGKSLLRRKARIDYFYSSPAPRAFETSEIVATTIGFPTEKIIKHEGLHEISQGKWEGRPIGEVYTPHVISRKELNPVGFSPEGGESALDGERRMLKVFNLDFLSKLGEKGVVTIAFTGHNGSIKCLLRAVQGSDPLKTYNTSIENCSITEFVFRSSGRFKGWNTVRINSDEHLIGCGYSPDGPSNY